MLEPYYGMKVKQIDFGMYVDRLTKISLRHGLVMPQNLYLVNKSLVTLEGILRQLDPDFDFIEIARPHVERLLLKRKDPLRVLRSVRKNAGEFSELVTVFPKQLHRTFRKLLRGDIRVKVQHEELQRLIRDVDKASNRLSFNIITAAIIVASSIIIHTGQGQMLFGMPVFGLIGYLLAAVLGFWILIGILRSGQCRKGSP
jgi:ubiquinone biosynthesis protein